MIERLKGLAVMLLSGVIWIGVHTNASAATIDLSARGLVANPMGAFFTESGTGISTFDGTFYSYLGDPLLDPGVAISSSPGTGDTDFSLALNGFFGDDLVATSEVAMDSETSIDILFSIGFNSLGISGSHILASITHADDFALAGSDIFSRPMSTDVSASIALTSVAPIPLPAGMLLLLTALGSLILVRRRTA